MLSLFHLHKNLDKLSIDHQLYTKTRKIDSFDKLYEYVRTLGHNYRKIESIISCDDVILT